MFGFSFNNNYLPGYFMPFYYRVFPKPQSHFSFILLHLLLPLAPLKFNLFTAYRLYVEMQDCCANHKTASEPHQQHFSEVFFFLLLFEEPIINTDINMFFLFFVILKSLLLLNIVTFLLPVQTLCWCIQ